jgi:hypothetical protein
MLLASVVLLAQLSGAAPPRAEVARPGQCADLSALCRMNPLFCPGAYPKGLEPCWPDAPRQPRNAGARPSPPSRSSESTHLPAAVAKAPATAPFPRVARRPSER